MQQAFPFDEIDDLYREVILHHYRNSRNKARIEEPDIEYDGFNPFCGDEVVLQLKLQDDHDHVGNASFHGQGCSISQASASMMTDLLKGRTLEEAEKLSEVFRQMMHGQEPSEEELEGMGDLEALQGVRKFPVRIKCALLAWATLEDGIQQYRQQQSSG